MYVRWPGIDSESRSAGVDHVKSTFVPTALLHLTRGSGQASRPWLRLHLDFAGPFENRMLLAIVDAHSKSFPTKTAISTVMIDCLCPVFASLELGHK